MGRGADVVAEPVAVELAQPVVGPALDRGVGGELVVVEHAAEQAERPGLVAGGRLELGLHERQLGPARVVLVVGPHPADLVEGPVGLAGVDPEHERPADLGGEAELVGRPAVERGRVGVGREVPALGVLLDLAQEHVGPGGHVGVALVGGPGPERLGRLVPAAGPGVELAQGQAHPGRPAAVAAVGGQPLLQDGDALVEPVGGGVRPAEPEPGLVPQPAVAGQLGRGHRLAELLLGPGQVPLVEVGLADDQERVVGPLGPGPRPEELGALVDGLLERPVLAPGRLGHGEHRDEPGPVDRHGGLGEGELAVLQRPRGVVVRVVVRPEVVVPAVQRRARPAPAEHDGQGQAGEDEQTDGRRGSHQDREAGSE